VALTRADSTLPAGRGTSVVVRRRVVLVCAGGLTTAALACGLTASFDGLQGGVRDAGEDGAVALDASPSDAGADGSVTPVDAGPPFCATHGQGVKLCDDFDEGQSIEAGWSAVDEYGGAAIGIDTTNWFSYPAAFQSAVNPSGAPASARLLENLPIDAAHVHAEFEMLLTPTSQGTLQLCVVHQVIADGTTYGLYYQEVNGALEAQLRALQADGTTYDQRFPIGAPPTAWTHVTIDMDMGDAGAFTVQHEGVTVASQTGVPTSTPSRTALFVELGFYTFVPGTGQASFDNAILDWP
jgi:hypothetical protein